MVAGCELAEEETCNRVANRLGRCASFELQGDCLIRHFQYILFFPGVPPNFAAPFLFSSFTNRAVLHFRNGAEFLN